MAQKLILENGKLSTVKHFHCLLVYEGSVKMPVQMGIIKTTAKISHIHI